MVYVSGERACDHWQIDRLDLSNFLSDLQDHLPFATGAQ